MRRAIAVALGVFVLGLVGLVLAATLHRTTKAFTLGVHVGAPVAGLKTGDTVCQRPIAVASGEEFDAVDMGVGTYHMPGSPLRVTVQDLGGHRLASAGVPGGYPDIGQQQVHHVRLDRTVAAPRTIAVCVRNLGPRPVALYGDIDFAARNSSAYVNGRHLGFDVALDFERATPRSMASQVPQMLSRASLFRFAGMGSWVYLLLAALLVLVAPWLLVRALRASDAETGATDGAARPAGR